MTDERGAAPEDKATPEDSADEQGAAAATPETIVIDGQQVPLSTVREWRDGGLRLQDYTKKTMAVADQRREVEQKEAALSEREAQIEARIRQLEAAQQGDPYATLDETIPGLSMIGKEVAALGRELKEVKQGLLEQRKESERIIADAETEDAWDRLLTNFGPGTARPFADPNKIRQAAESRGWKPTAQSVEDAFWIEYGFQAGEATGEARARRARETPVPMGGGQLPGIRGSTPRDVPAAPPKPMSQTSMEELAAQALANPNRPRAAMD